MRKRHHLTQFGFLLSSILLATLPAAAQRPFVPATIDSIELAKHRILLASSYRTEVDALKGNNKKFIASYYEQRYKNLDKLFADKAIFAVPQPQSWLDSLAATIIQRNADLHQKFYSCYFLRTASPNAFATGEGVILVNTGLLPHLQNPGELVFVLCHELAHQYLDHSNKGIEQYVNNLYSDESQQEFKKIAHTTYNKRAEIEKFSQKIVFDTKRHTRDHESEADSLACIFMHNAGYSMQYAISALHILDTIDNQSFNVEQVLRKYFNSSSFPFKDKWLHKNEGLLGGHFTPTDDNKMADSLKTHPSCLARISTLRRIFQIDSSSGQSTKKDARFEELKQTMEYEVPAGYDASKQYGLCLYYTLQLLERKPDDAYLITLTGKTLYNIAAAQRKHEYGKSVEQPSPNNPPSYNTLLQFLDNLHEEEYLSIAYYFLQPYAGKFSDQADIQQLLVKIKQQQTN